MDQEKLGSILFLASLMGTGCAEGVEGAGPRPSPYAGDGDDTRGASPWTDPFETSGAGDDAAGDSAGSDGDGGDSGWPSEGETGHASGGSTGDFPSNDGGADDGEATTGAPDGGDEGDYGSSGYAEPPPTGNPCPDLVQLYTDCIPGLDYATELGYCEAARQSAASISAGCSVAHNDYLACLSTLDCATLLVRGVPFPCLLQSAAVELSC